MIVGRRLLRLWLLFYDCFFRASVNATTKWPKTQAQTLSHSSRTLQRKRVLLVALGRPLAAGSIRVHSSLARPFPQDMRSWTMNGDDEKREIRIASFRAPTFSMGSTEIATESVNVIPSDLPVHRLILHRGCRVGVRYFHRLGRELSW